MNPYESISLRAEIKIPSISEVRRKIDATPKNTYFFGKSVFEVTQSFRFHKRSIMSCKFDSEDLFYYKKLENRKKYIPKLSDIRHYISRPF